MSGFDTSSSTLDPFGSNFDIVPSSYDPFAEDFLPSFGATEYIHIRIQQRNGKKSVTTVQGLNIADDKILRKILQKIKKEFCCNGNVVEDKELGKVIQLQGDQRNKVAAFLAKAEITTEDQIKIHGF